MHWQTSRYRIDLSSPKVMGVVNVTPDSFFDGGLHASVSAAIAHCQRLVAEGADMLDIGGESTRPGADSLGAAHELTRVLPVLREALRLGVPVSVDTSEPMVMREALALGADIINDVRALQRPGAVAAVAAHPKAGLCLMHMRGEPTDMQSLTDYDDVIADVRSFLAARMQAAESAGVHRERIVLDPGIGFAKSPDHNLILTAHLDELLAPLGRPVLVGWSRKGTLGRITGRTVGDRLAASLAAALAAVHHGAAIVRAHDVAATVDALKVWQAVATGHLPKT
jgi:dihydropteroate synthase